MESFSVFFKSLLNSVDFQLNRDLNIDEIRSIISKINEYFYTNYEGIGNTFILDEYREYFSEFHKFWEKYNVQILNPTIDEEKCNLVAEILHKIYIKNKNAFYELYDTFGLSHEEVCKIRFFSANQDFRGSRSFQDFVKCYIDDPNIFDKININQNPEDFLKDIGVTSLSQNDKRIKYAQKASQLLIDLNIEPFDLIQYFKHDILEIREYLINYTGAGFGNKKADMFLRDMVVLGIWKDIINFEKINVASDINTVKVALRTGIFKTAVPLVSSFIDIFCYQYSLIDNTSALAWRRVWEIWKIKYPSECIESPCLIDYLVYRVVGKEFCKESLAIFRCNVEQHTFKWHSSRNRRCQVCAKKGIFANSAEIIGKVLPCMDDEGYLVIEKNDYVSGKDSILPNIKECPFISVCNPKSNNFIKLNPPKSISILGQTGWESAKTRKAEGGGGLMA
jgi:hypothetical protein